MLGTQEKIFTDVVLELEQASRREKGDSLLSLSLLSLL